MKTLVKTISVIAITFGALSTANANVELVGTDDSVSTKICLAAASGSKLKLNQAIKDAKLTKRKAQELVTCNDVPLINFVEQYGSNIETVNNYITSGEYGLSLTAKN